jgi:hypothetical protein
VAVRGADTVVHEAQQFVLGVHLGTRANQQRADSGRTNRQERRASRARHRVFQWVSHIDPFALSHTTITHTAKSQYCGVLIDPVSNFSFKSVGQLFVNFTDVKRRLSLCLHPRKMAAIVQNRSRQSSNDSTHAFASRPRALPKCQSIQLPGSFPINLRIRSDG